MDTLIESSIDKTKIYFHGSASKKFDTIKTPSYEHPFYVTPDIKYAAAFATKRYSSTGSYSKIDEICFEKSDADTYIYIISLNPNAKFLDIRNSTIESINEVKELKQLIPIELQPIFDNLIESISKIQKNTNSGLDEFGLDVYILFDEFWGFCDNLAKYTISNYSARKYTRWEIEKNLYREIDLNNRRCKSVYGYPVLFNGKNAADCNDILGPIIDAVSNNPNKQIVNFFHKIEFIDGPHQFMSKFFDTLDENGYSGIITAERDTNDNSSQFVYTNYAIGCWNVNAFDKVSVIPIHYSWLKENIPDIENNKLTNSSANNTILKLVKKYKLIK